MHVSIISLSVLKARSLKEISLKTKFRVGLCSFSILKDKLFCVLKVSRGYLFFPLQGPIIHLQYQQCGIFKFFLYCPVLSIEVPCD